MKVLVLGVGRVGYNIAKHMVSPENQVTVVDSNEEVLNFISDRLDVQPVLGQASHPDVLEKAGAEKTDLIIALTDSDEVNMIACEIAHSLFDIDIKIARVRNQNYLNTKHRQVLFQSQNLSVDFIISPEVEVAKAINLSIQIGSVSNVVDIFDKVRMVSMRCTDLSPIANTPIRLLSNLFPDIDMSVVAIQRGDSVIIPEKSDIIQSGDQVYLVVFSEQIPQMKAAFGHLEQMQRQVTIVGCGNIGMSLAQMIENTQPDIYMKVVDKLPEMSEAASRFLKNAEVLCGDIMEHNILKEAGVSDCDIFVSVTDDDKTNILSALLAKDRGAKLAMALLNDKRNAKFAISLGIDSVINPNDITVSTVLRAIRKHKIKSLYSIDGGVEILEVDVGNSGNIIGIQVSDLTVPGQVFVAVLKRDNEVFIFPKNFTIGAEDRLVFVVKKEAVHKVEKIVSARSSYI